VIEFCPFFTKPILVWLVLRRVTSSLETEVGLFLCVCGVVFFVRWQSRGEVTGDAIGLKRGGDRVRLVVSHRV